MIYVDTRATKCFAVCTDHKLDDTGYVVIPNNTDTLKKAYQSALADADCHWAEKHTPKVAVDGS
jgi:hypothetical protein